MFNLRYQQVILPELPPPPCRSRGTTVEGGQSLAGSSARTCYDSRCCAGTCALQTRVTHSPMVSSERKTYFQTFPENKDQINSPNVRLSASGIN